MTNRKGIGTGGAIGLAAVAVVAVLFATGTINLSGVSTGPSDTVETKDATLNLAAEQLGSSSKISTTAYATLQDGTVVSKSLSSGQFTAWSVFTNKDSGIEVRAFDSSNYPITSTLDFDGSTQLNKVIKTADIASSSDVSIELRETSGSSDNDGKVDIAAGGQATLDSVRAKVDIQDVYWNTGMVMFDTPDNSNVSISMPNAEQVAVPDSAPSGVDVAFEAYNPSMGDDSFEEFAVHDSSRVVLDGDDSNDPSESITVYVDDYQAYQSSETGDIEYGVTDDTGTGLGLDEQSKTLTVN